MKYLNLLFIGLIIVINSACGAEESFDATGTFESTEIIVSAEETGKLLSFDVEEGMYVEQSALIGVIDTVQLYLKKCQLEATRKSFEKKRPDVNKQVAATQEEIAKAQRERDRVRRLLKDNAANRKQLDDWNSQLAYLQKKLAAQISSLDNSDSSLTEQSSSVAIQVAQITDRLKKCYITAPISGTILSKYTEPNELAVLGKPLFKIADMKHLFLRAYVTSQKLSQVDLGEEVTVFADFGNNQKLKYSGRVSWIADKAEFTPKTILTDDERANQVYAVKIAVVNDGKIKLGMYGEVKF